MRCPLLFAAAAVLLTASSSASLYGQHEGHEMPSARLIPESRAGSGTSWLPDDSPMHAVHFRWGSWSAMLHGAAALVYDAQGGPRGDDEVVLTNWVMLAARREVAGGELELRAMGSAELWTVGADGYPLLVQSGESYRAAPLHDRQHPHDLFMELAALYERPITRGAGLSLYAGAVGEPAVGPVAFPHRPSAHADPFAPLGHHWQDATHITFGVVTAGIFTRHVKLEASAFNGREPDERRTDFDFRRLDSYGGRLSVNPTPSLSLAAWYAYLESPEALEPDEPIHRFGVSVLAAAGRWSGALVWGANRHLGGPTEPSFLIEAALAAGRHELAVRGEWLRKSAADLLVPAAPPDREYDVAALVLSGSREVARAGALRLALGARGAVTFLPPALESLYGSRTPAGAAVFLRVAP